jgi:hypothetical protein
LQHSRHASPDILYSRRVRRLWHDRLIGVDRDDSGALLDKEIHCGFPTASAASRRDPHAAAAPRDLVISDAVSWTHNSNLALQSIHLAWVRPGRPRHGAALSRRSAQRDSRDTAIWLYLYIPLPHV